MDKIIHPFQSQHKRWMLRYLSIESRKFIAGFSTLKWNCIFKIFHYGRLTACGRPISSSGGGGGGGGSRSSSSCSSSCSSSSSSK